MKPGPPQIWPADTAALRGASGCASAFRTDMYGRPLRCKKNFRTDAARDRVRSCIRPMMRQDQRRWPVWDSRIRSTSLERARSAIRAPGSPDPVSPTLRHTCPSPHSHRDDLAPTVRSDGDRRRSSVDLAACHQRPGDARCLVGQGDDYQHGWLAGQHARQPRIR